jgi:hypothetical protein
MRQAIAALMGNNSSEQSTRSSVTFAHRPRICFRVEKHKGSNVVHKSSFFQLSCARCTALHIVALVRHTDRHSTGQRNSNIRSSKLGSSQNRMSLFVSVHGRVLASISCAAQGCGVIMIRSWEGSMEFSYHIKNFIRTQNNLKRY